MTSVQPPQDVDVLSPQDLQNMIQAGNCLLIDVREENEFVQGHIAGAELFPLSSFDVSLLPDADGKTLIFICALGKRSAMAAHIAAQAVDTPIANLEGGLQAWIGAGYPLAQA